MSEFITCTPRTLAPEDLAAAAETAIKTNPQNRPDLEELAGIIGFSPEPGHLAVATKKYWGLGGVRLTVGFLDNTSQDLRTRILSHMNAWSKTANVQFTETSNATDAQVRINRETSNQREWNGYWSFLGTDILDNQGPFGQTMNLEGFTTQTTDEEFYRVVRHETGHTLGFPHEHMRKDLINRIDRGKAISYYKRLTGWNEQQIIRQVLTPLEESSLISTPEADQYSIMSYQVPGSVTTDGKPIVGGLDIDQCDYDFCAQIYPK